MPSDTRTSSLIESSCSGYSKGSRMCSASEAIVIAFSGSLGPQQPLCFMYHQALFDSAKSLISGKVFLPFAHFGSSFPRIGSLVLRNKELPMVFLYHCGQQPV